MRRRRTRTFLLAMVNLFGIFVTGGAVWSHGPKAWPVPKEAHALKNPVPSTEAGRAVGRRIYGQHCASCHGNRGDGKGSMAVHLAAKPADFTDSHMMHEMTDGEIFWKMTEGRDPMPSFKKVLSEEQRWQLVHYLRSLAPAGPPSHHSHHPK